MFKLELTTGGSAFHDEDNEEFNDITMALEMKRIFEKVCHQIMVGETKGVAMDSNGNKVGKWRLTK